MEPKENDNLTPEEQIAEQEALAEVKEVDIREKVVTDLGLTDDDDNKALIDSIVAREVTHRKKLSEAIGQKIKWRTAANPANPPKPPVDPKSTPAFDPEAIRKQTEDTVRTQLEQRDLDELDHSDEIKAEIKKLAQLHGTSVRQAAQDPYIKHLVEQAQAADRVNEAGVARTPRATNAPAAGIPKFDLATEEGRQEYDDWKKSREA